MCDIKDAGLVQGVDKYVIFTDAGLFREKTSMGCYRC